MTVYLIRHSQTQGNLERRYIGSTDQPLCPQGREALEGREMPSVDGLYVSPSSAAARRRPSSFPTGKWRWWRTCGSAISGPLRAAPTRR